MPRIVSDVEARLQADIFNPGFETGATASIGDPNDVNANGFVGAVTPRVPTANVPAPESAAPLLVGLVALVLARRFS